MEAIDEQVIDPDREKVAAIKAAQISALILETKEFLPWFTVSYK